MLRALAPYLKRYRWYLVTGFLLVGLKNLFQSSAPQVIRAAIDHLSGTPPVDSFIYRLAQALFGWLSDGPVGYIALFLLIEIGHGIFLYGMRQTLIVASRKVEYDLRSDLFAHLQRMHLQFFQYARTGDLISRMTNDLSNVRDVLGPGIMYTANTVIAFVYVVPMMLLINVQLTMWAFVPLFVLSFATQRLSRLIHIRSQRVQEKLSDISAAVQENFAGIRVVKSYVREEHEIARLHALNADYIRLNMDMVRVRGVLMSSVILTIGLSVAVLLWLGGGLVMQGRVTLGEFTAFNFYLAMLIWPMIALGWVLNIFQRGSASMKRLTEFRSLEPQIKDRPGLAGLPSISGKIEFRHLTFRYREDAPAVLKNITLTIEPGMTVGVVGATGSGKSTLVNLIPRLYELPSGCVFVDGREIREIPLEVLRRSIGMVPQDTFLFSDTILQNIVFGMESYEPDRVRWAAEVAQLRATVEEFPEKYETVIGERGITLSGGQKQRLAIARAVIREPNILILDDALSSVDTHTEDEILQRLERLMENRTTLVVSHRIQTVQRADKIVLLAEGEIAEEGTHAELLALNGRYARIYERQLLEQEIEAI
jgi:ATP-binding cassette subfamily B protein